MKYRILNLDNKKDYQGENFDGCEVEFDNEELLLSLYFGKTPSDIVGFVTVSVDKKEKAVFGEINFHKHFTPEQIKVYKSLAPCIGAEVVERDSEDERKLKKIKLKSVSLDIFNSDSRIESLERQEKNAEQTN